METSPRSERASEWTEERRLICFVLRQSTQATTPLSRSFYKDSVTLVSFELAARLRQPFERGSLARPHVHSERRLTHSSATLPVTAAPAAVLANTQYGVVGSTRTIHPSTPPFSTQSLLLWFALLFPDSRSMLHTPKPPSTTEKQPRAKACVLLRPAWLNEHSQVFAALRVIERVAVAPAKTSSGCRRRVGAQWCSRLEAVRRGALGVLQGLCIDMNSYVCYGFLHRRSLSLSLSLYSIFFDSGTRNTEIMATRSSVWSPWADAARSPSLPAAEAEQASCRSVLTKCAARFTLSIMAPFHARIKTAGRSKQCARNSASSLHCSHCDSLPIAAIASARSRFSAAQEYLREKLGANSGGLEISPTPALVVEGWGA